MIIQDEQDDHANVDAPLHYFIGKTDHMNKSEFNFNPGLLQFEVNSDLVKLALRYSTRLGRSRPKSPFTPLKGRHIMGIFAKYKIMYRNEKLDSL